MRQKFENEMLDKKLELLQNQVLDFAEMRKKTRPGLETLKIVLIYVVFGCLWILLSDTALDLLVSDPDVNHRIQTYKGWFYVAITGIIFFVIIFNRMKLFKRALDEVFMGYEELCATHEELAAMDETLAQQFEELQESRENVVREKEMSDSIINSAPMMVLVLDAHGFIMRFNQYARKVTGYEESEIIGCKINKIMVQDDDYWEAEKLLADVLEGKRLLNNELDVQCKDGTAARVYWNNSVLRNKNGEIESVVSMGIDMAERIAMEKRLNTLAYFDNLTGLPNRTKLVEYLDSAIDDARGTGKKLGLICLDVDNFKRINDTMGHAVGDELIIELGRLLSAHVKAPNRIARLGGDEFAILLTNMPSDAAIQKEIERINHFVRRAWTSGDQEFFVSASFGAAIFPEHGDDSAQLMQNADTAMSYSKEKGKDKMHYFSRQMQEDAWKHVQKANKLRHAIEHEEFMLYYQPQIDLNSGEIIGAEALIRWFNPTDGFIPPMEFIPYAEETGYMSTIEDWVLATAYIQKSDWSKQGYDALKLSVNISATTLTQPGFIENIREIMAQFNTCQCKCEIEITETAVIDDLEKAVQVLSQLKALGISIALDDFGTGYSSLTYLRKLPIDILKIDKEFINNVAENEDDAYIFETIIHLAHSLNLKVVAEGVETVEQRDFLIQTGCDIGQGYLFSKPMPASDLEKFLQTHGKMV